jgi:membrane protein DedA with SNARE-associated domain
MIEELTQWIMNLMQNHGPAMVFIGVIIESVIIPIPSPLVIMGAGALLIPTGQPYPVTFVHIVYKIIIPGSIASTLGAYFPIAIAYWGGRPIINRFQRFLGFSWNDILWMEKNLEGRVNSMIFFLRALPIVPLSLISAAAGAIRIPFMDFTVWTFLGTIPRCLILSYLGYLTRDSYQGLAGQINAIESIVAFSIVVGMFAVILWLRAHLKKK